MLARSTTLTGAPVAVDAAIDYVRDEVMPAVTRMEGCLGFSLVVDREGGRCIATSSWTSQTAMTASDDLLAPHRAHAGRLLAGTALVEEWDVALMHRDHASMDGAACRITWAKCSDVDALVEAFGSRMLPVLDHSAGFCSTSMFVDRWRGRACITVTFDSRRALAATRTQAEQNRLVLTELADVAFEEVVEFELVLAHLRVPELV
jgi:quinol monooxygenase YgiN